jgi:tetratricopeptide (TPR) repeat protein
MPDPQSSQSMQAGGPGPAGEDARIEQLLVGGLDHYFAGDFESAINLWTRVLFLDRTHDRARAYIERARSAQAEQQRQTEALVHQGLDAFHRGDVEYARTLLSDALDQGASHDLTLGVLDRIERLDVASGRGSVPIRVGRQPRSIVAGRTAAPVPTTRSSPARFWGLTLALLVGLAAASWWIWNTSGWPALWPVQADAARMAAIPEVNAPLPVPSAAEAYMRRAQHLFETGRLRDALAEFDRVPAGDPLRASADDMRAHIQRELLALALADAAPTSPAPSLPAAPRPE